MVQDFLKGLRFSYARPERIPAGASDPMLHMRERLVAAIKEHQRIVEADLKGKELALTITKRGSNGEIMTVPKRVLRWYFRTSNGDWHTFVRYGTRPLSFPGGDAILVGSELKDVVGIYDRLIQATEAGRLDELILKAKKRAPRSTRQVPGEDEQGNESEGEEDQQELPTVGADQSSGATLRRKRRKQTGVKENGGVLGR